MRTRSGTQVVSQQCTSARKSSARKAAQPVAVRLDELPAEVCGQKLASVKVSTITAVPRCAYKTSGLPRAGPAGSCNSTSPALRHSRGLHSADSVQARIELCFLQDQAPAGLRIRPQRNRRFKEALTKSYWTAIHADLATRLWRALGRHGAHPSWPAYQSCRLSVHLTRFSAVLTPLLAQARRRKPAPGGGSVCTALP
jgi:hypothetical protein